VPAAAKAPARVSVEERLRQLNDLFKKGLISKQEFDAKKAEIFKEL
jgi:Short C-terminal domain